jgi:hypothetical protein
MPISPYGHNDMGTDEEWAAYHARVKREEKAELEALREEYRMSSLGDRPPSMAAAKLRRLMELEAKDGQLLPCPFCGGAAQQKLEFGPRDTAKNAVYAYQCENRKTGCPVNMRTHYGTEAETRKQWNTRV